MLLFLYLKYLALSLDSFSKIDELQDFFSVKEIVITKRRQTTDCLA